MNQECLAAGVPVPEYRTDASGLMVQFSSGFMQTEEVTEKTPQKTPDRIIDLLMQDGRFSIKDLARQIGKSPSAVQRVLNKLQEARIVERIGPDKGGYWVVKGKS